MKEITKSELGLSYGHLPEDQRRFMDSNADTVLAIVNKALKGAISLDEADERVKAACEAVKAANESEVTALKNDVLTLTDQLKKLGEAMEKAKQQNVNVNPILSKYNEAIDTMYDSEKFKQFVDGTTRDARNFELKAVSMTNDYTGTHLITAQSNDIVSQIKDKQLHIRDLATVLPGDPKMLAFAWQMIYDLDRNARYVAENGTLPESTFKVKEETSSVKRVGHHFKISKRMLKSRVFVRAFILTQAVQGVLNAEDFGILFGDGSGDNLKGITKYEGCLPAETIIGTAIISGVAGTVDSIEAVGNGVNVKFKKAYDLMQEGMKITFAGATTNTAINAVHDVIKVTDDTIYLAGVNLDAGNNETKLATDVGALTWTVKSGAYHSVSSPNSIDALETAVAIMHYAQYRPTLMLLNPITINAIRTEKTTFGDRLKLVEGMNGSPVIGGLRVIPCTDIPVGKYFIGDFNNGAKLIEYTGLTLDWADDVETKLKNQVVLIAQEEIILAVENPWAFTYGTISALKAAITAE